MRTETAATACTVTPLRNMVLVEPVPAAQQQTFTVIQPERSVERFIVVACGPEVHDIQPAQTVLANRLAATTVGSHLLLSESAILAIL